MLFKRANGTHTLLSRTFFSWLGGDCLQVCSRMLFKRWELWAQWMVTWHSRNQQRLLFVSYLYLFWGTRLFSFCLFFLGRRMRQGMSTELREDAACSAQRASSLPFSVDALMARAGTRPRAETPRHGNGHSTLLYGPPAPEDCVPSSPVKPEASDRDEAAWPKSACSPQPRRFTHNIFTAQNSFSIIKVKRL